MALEHITGSSGIEKRFREVYESFVDVALSTSYERIRDKTSKKGYLSQLVDSQSTSGFEENVPLSDQLEILVASYDETISEAEDAIKATTRRFGKKETAASRTIIAEQEEIKRGAIEQRRSLEKKIKEYQTPSQVYAFAFPTQTDSGDSFRLVLPVLSEDQEKQGTQQERLVDQVYSEVLGDKHLGNNDPAYVKVADISFGEKRQFVGIDVLGYKIDKKTAREIPAYMKRLVEETVNGSVDESERKIEDRPPISLSVVTPYKVEEPFVERAKKKLGEIGEDEIPREDKLLGVILESIGFERGDVEDTPLYTNVQRFLREQFPDAMAQPSSLERMLGELEGELIGTLNGLVGEEVYHTNGKGNISQGDQTSPHHTASFSSDYVRLIDGKACIPLDHAGRVMQIPPPVLERGYEMGTFHRYSAGGRNFVAVKEIIDAPDKIVASGRKLHFDSEPVVSLTDFIAEHPTIDRENLKKGIRANKIRGVYDPKMKVYAIRKSTIPQILEEYEDFTS